MENLSILILTVLKYNICFSLGIVLGARLVEHRLFEEMKDFYHVDFSEVEIPSQVVFFSMLLLPLSVILVPFCAIATFGSIVWMTKMKGEGYETLQCILVELSLLRKKTLARIVINKNRFNSDGNLKMRIDICDIEDSKKIVDNCEKVLSYAKPTNK